MTDYFASIGSRGVGLYSTRARWNPLIGKGVDSGLPRVQLTPACEASASSKDQHRAQAVTAAFRRDDIAAARTGRGELARELADLPGPLAEIANRQDGLLGSSSGDRGSRGTVRLA
jgi:hypothetical protein